jgi:hypothetical protein
MGRKSEPLFERNGILCARYREAGKRVLLSLDTGDKALAMQRYPIVVSSGLSWQSYQKTLSGWKQNSDVTIRSISTKDALVEIDPHQKMIADRNALTTLLGSAVKAGVAKYNEKTGYWKIGIRGEDDLVTQLNRHKQILSTSVVDQKEEIETFYLSAVSQLFADKKTAIRNA